MKYSPQEIEKKWQNYWETNQTFACEDFSEKPKYYVLDMFPYPSGAGLHVGHPEGYTASDILCRYKRMKGFNVLHPMGWDAFGLPAEQYALKTGTHPAITTEKNINNFRRQIKSLGFSYDWNREISTCAPDYYRWTQWIFRKLYEKGLAYMDDVEVNWCPALGTVLANEEVIDGKSERGGHEVLRKPMRQWMLRITDYAESLLSGLEELDWPEGVKEMQRNWIGKSSGATVNFKISKKPDLSFEIYTTRPDTLFGATYCVLAPEHPLLKEIIEDEQKEEVDQYISEAINKLERTRLEDADNKTGVFTGAYALNPLSGKELPIYVADYVLMSYGSGAIMAVPAHDKRDWEFAKKFGLEILEVVEGGSVDKEAYSGEGELINSDFLNGLSSKDAKEKVIDYLKENNLGTDSIKYKLRDWLFSRQRYWGEPFPVVHSGDSVSLVPEEELPVMLPEIEAYQPTEDGKPPLARAKEWLEYKDKDGKDYIRETNTMPQWAGSCWYYLRYIDPKNSDAPWCPKKEAAWMPVDLYIGGAEHAVLHLLYSRFWHHVLFDLGLVSTKEPYKKLVNQGMILGEDGAKMSKSKGNVVNPDDIVDKYGADTLRIYEMFMGPLEQVKPWNNKSVGGMFKFLVKVWKLFIDNEEGQISSKISSSNADSDNLKKKLHQTIKKVTEEVEALKFHTALASLMTLLNEMTSEKAISEDTAKAFVLLLSPFAPHLCEELWSKLGEETSLAYEPWPLFKEELTKESELKVPIQVNGKKRDLLIVEDGLSKETIIEKAKELEKIKKYLVNSEIVKEVYVPNRLINFVVKS